MQNLKLNSSHASLDFTYFGQSPLTSSERLRFRHSSHQLSDGDEIENDESHGDNDVNYREDGCVRAVEVAQQTDRNVDADNHQHDYEEWNLKFSQKRINFDR